MKKILSYNTSAGTFYIAEFKGKYYPVFEEENFGGYTTIQQAIEDLVGGHISSLRGGIDSSKLGIPADPAEWEQA